MAVRRNLISLAREISEKASNIELGSDPDDQIVEAEQSLYNLANQGGNDSGFESFVSATSRAIKIASKAYQRDGSLSGLSTGLIDIDKKLGGLNPSDLLIIAGRPSMGKTALAMSSTQLASRILSEASKVPSDQIRRGEMTEDEFRRFVEAAQVLETCALFIDDTAALPISSLAARARRLKRTQGLDLLIVDYLQLVRPALNKMQM